MIDMDKPVIAFCVLCWIVALSGCCTTTETNTATHESSVATASAGLVAVSVATETTTITQSMTPPPTQPPTVDVLSDAKKPCGTVAADAPKFVEPETK